MIANFATTSDPANCDSAHDPGTPAAMDRSWEEVSHQYESAPEHKNDLGPSSGPRHLSPVPYHANFLSAHMQGGGGGARYSAMSSTFDDEGSFLNNMDDTAPEDMTLTEAEGFVFTEPDSFTFAPSSSSSSVLQRASSPPLDWDPAGSSLLVLPNPEWRPKPEVPDAADPRFSSPGQAVAPVFAGSSVQQGPAALAGPEPEPEPKVKGKDKKANKANKAKRHKSSREAQKYACGYPGCNFSSSKLREQKLGDSKTGDIFTHQSSHIDTSKLSSDGKYTGGDYMRVCTICQSALESEACTSASSHIKNHRQDLEEELEKLKKTQVPADDVAARLQHESKKTDLLERISAMQTHGTWFPYLGWIKRTHGVYGPGRRPQNGNERPRSPAGKRKRAAKSRSKRAKREDSSGSEDNDNDDDKGSVDDYSVETGDLLMLAVMKAECQSQGPAHAPSSSSSSRFAPLPPAPNLWFGGTPHFNFPDMRIGR